MYLGETRQRVLIEDENPAWYRLVTRLVNAEEYEFAYCRGPFLVEGGCPILRGEPCPKVEWADSILHSLDEREPCNVALLEALKRRDPGMVQTTLPGKPTTYCLTRRRAIPAFV